MNFNVKDLGIIYRAFIKYNSLSSNDNCPPIERILSSLDPKCSISIKLKVADHIGGCNRCMDDFLFLKHLQIEHNELLDYLKHSKKPSQNISITNRTTERYSFRDKWQLFIYPKRFAIIITGLLFLLTGILLIHFNRTYVDKERTYAPHIRTIYPSGIVSLSPKLTFTWEGIKDSSYYIIELFDDDLNLFWRSPNISETHSELPYHLLAQLEHNQPYYWIVIAALLDGKILESNLLEFILCNENK